MSRRTATNNELSNDLVDDFTGEPVKHYKEQRVCRERGCNTILTIYNPNRYCFKHTSARIRRANDLTTKSMCWAKHGMIYGEGEKAVKDEK